MSSATVVAAQTKESRARVQGQQPLTEKERGSGATCPRCAGSRFKLFKVHVEVQSNACFGARRTQHTQLHTTHYCAVDRWLYQLRPQVASHWPCPRAEAHRRHSSNYRVLLVAEPGGQLSTQPHKSPAVGRGLSGCYICPDRTVRPGTNALPLLPVLKPPSTASAQMDRQAGEQDDHDGDQR